MGFKIRNVKTISQEQISNKPEVPLVKFSKNPDVFIVRNGRLLHIKNLQILEDLGFKESDIAELKNFQKTMYQRVKLVKAPDDSRVYYLTESEMKRHLPNVEVFLSYGNKWEDIITITKIELASFSDNDLIREAGKTEVYKIEGDKKRWIKTPETFNKFGFDWTKIATINAIESNTYLDGEPIE